MPVWRSIDLLFYSREDVILKSISSTRRMVADTDRPGREQGGSRLVWTKPRGGRGILMFFALADKDITALILV